MQDHCIQRFSCDLVQHSSLPHQKVEERVERIFNQALNSVLRRFSDRHFVRQDLYQARLVIDMGEIVVDELEQQLPRRLERALEDWLSDYKRKNTLEDNNLEKEEGEEIVHPLVFFLMNGVYPWYGEKKKPFKTAWSDELKKGHFIAHLYTFNWPRRAIQRLVRLAYLDLLKTTLKALIPEHSSFILQYHEELLEQRAQLKEKTNESQVAYHKIIWEFSLQYVLNAKGSYFSRKQFVLAQIRLFVQHYNLSQQAFFSLLYEGVAQLKIFNKDQVELFQILQELKETFWETNPEATETKEEDGEIRSIQDLEDCLRQNKGVKRKQQIKLWLLQSGGIEQLKKHWLNPLKTTLLYAVVEVLIGKQQREIAQAYHEQLWEYHQNTVEGGSKSSFQQAVWTFTLDYFNRSFSSYFEARLFVEYHSNKIASYYRIHARTFLESLLRTYHDFKRSHNRRSILLFQILSALVGDTEPHQEEEKEFLVLSLGQSLLNNYAKEFFHSQRELYFFFEACGNKIAKQLGNTELSSIEVLLSVMNELKLRSTTEGYLSNEQQRNLIRIINELNTMLTYEGISEVDQGVDIDSSYGVLFSSLLQLNDQQEWLDFKRKKEPLSFSLFRKLLKHSEQLSAKNVEELRMQFKSKSVQQQLLSSWWRKMNNKDHEQWIRLTFGDVDGWRLDLYSIVRKMASENGLESLVVHYLEFLIESDESISKSEALDMLLTKLFTQQALFDKVEFGAQIEMAIQTLGHRQFHFLNYLKLLRTDQLEFTARQRRNEGKHNKHHLEKLIATKEEDWRKLTKQEQIVWEDSFIEMVLNLSTEWEELEAKYYDLIERLKKFSNRFQQFILHKQQQAENLRRIRIEWGMATYKEAPLVHFLLFLNNQGPVVNYNFKLIDETSLNRFIPFVLKGKVKQWLLSSEEIHISFFHRVFKQDSWLIIDYYQELTAVYYQIQAQFRPNTTTLFYRLFWEFVFTQAKRRKSAWQVLGEWFRFFHEQWRVNISTLGIKTERWSNQHLKQWSALLERLKLPNNKLNKSKALGVSELEQVEKDERQEESPSLAEMGGIEAVYTGLILLHPFLKQLFKSLGFLNGEGAFLGIEEQSKAVLLLYYMATGEKYNVDEVEEEDLVFLKLICSLKPADLLSLSGVVKEDSYEMADQLLNACLSHWEKLQNSSVTSLQNTFLKRKGRIEERDDAFQLQVEKSGTDILLDSLPWSFSMINFSWLEQTIFVAWR